MWAAVDAMMHDLYLSFTWSLWRLVTWPLISWTNKKSDLMRMRRARAYSSSCSQVILIYLHSFRRNSLFCSQKNHSRSSMLTILRNSSSVLVDVWSMFARSCKRRITVKELLIVSLRIRESYHKVKVADLFLWDAMHTPFQSAPRINGCW